MSVGSGVWTDHRATRVATFAVVLAAMSLLCAPMFGPALIESLQRSLGLPRALSHLGAVALSIFVGAPAFVIATLAQRNAHSEHFQGARNARIARRLALVASALALFTAQLASCLPF